MSKVGDRNKKLELYVNHYKGLQDTMIAINFIRENGAEFGLTDADVPNFRKRVGEARQRIGVGKASKKRMSKQDTQPAITAAMKLDILAQKETHKQKILGWVGTRSRSTEEVAALLREPIEYARFLIEELKKERYNLLDENGKFFLDKNTKQSGLIQIDLKKYKNKTYKFGATADNHLNSQFSRLDVVHAAYDLFAKEGITDVFNGGNYIEGEARFNRQEILNVGMARQIDYFVRNYPQRKGITTHIISGDDHEGWYFQREGINIGEYMQMKAEQAGRFDLKDLGYVLADVPLEAKKGSAKMRVMHGGGGTAYALSYTPQKMIETLQGGTKPQILLLGHYHKADYFYYRDVHCVQLGCTQDQSTFMVKKKIMAALGVWILEFEQSEDGAINRFRPEWIPFFNKEYYERKSYYIV